MRCNNCGWNNPEGATKCAKCNQILDPKSSAWEWPSYSNGSLKENDDTFIVCEKCGYQLADNVSVCPECGYQRNSKKTQVLQHQGSQNSNKETVVDHSTIIQEKTSPKATQFDATPSEEKRNPRATVVVDNTETGTELTSQPESTEEKITEESYSYKLLAIDRPVIDTKSNAVSPLGVIELKSSIKLDWELNDIVLIGGLRFARVE